MQRLIVMTGLPGTGKSSIAEAISKKLGVPVFAKDWLKAALRRCGFAQEPGTAQRLGDAGYEGSSQCWQNNSSGWASLPFWIAWEYRSIRSAWRGLASTYSAGWYVIESSARTQPSTASACSHETTRFPTGRSGVVGGRARAELLRAVARGASPPRCPPPTADEYRSGVTVCAGNLTPPRRARSCASACRFLQKRSQFARSFARVCASISAVFTKN